MYVKRNLRLPFVLRYTWTSLLWTSIYSTAALVVFFHLNIRWIDVPFELVSSVGIAVAFFIGFKNNQAYERFWEGRKVWGSIVNLSRVWASQLLSLAGNRDESATRERCTVLVYRHLAWINALRVQLRQPTASAVRENILVERLVASHSEDSDVLVAVSPYLSDAEANNLRPRTNIATHLVKAQADAVRQLREDGAIDGFGQMMLMNTLEKAYDFQGMCERIKHTPFPRQFAYFSQVFTTIFCLLLPLGLLDVFERELVAGIAFADLLDTRSTTPRATFYAMVPLSVLVSWIFLTWEKIGDSSEDPFEGRPHDVSMTALCRTIEIDLREMLDEDVIPAKITPRDDILY